jgi:hypothetical protein
MSIVYEKTNIIPPEICKKVISIFENVNDKQQGLTSNGLELNLKKTIDMYMNPNDNSWKQIEKYITTKILNEITPFMDYMSSNVFKLSSFEHFISIFGGIFGETLTLTGIQVGKYETGGYFKPHIDVDSRNERIFSIILYLNTLERGQGGDTIFYDGRVITPEEGKLVIFPTTWTHLHQGCEVIRGCKYIITGFLCKKCVIP